jgi:DnaJ-class molecular chaperone
MDLYTVLGVSKKADQEEIKKAYRDQAKILHPDKPTGNAEKFKELQSAYEVLSDEKRRQVYDMTGETQEGGGPQMGGGPFGFPFGGMGMPGGFAVDMSDIFGSMFGGMRPGTQGGPRRQVKRPKGPNKVQDMPVSLSDFYHGKKIRINLGRQVFCKECEGEGCLNWKTCSACKGEGVKETMIQIGPGMMAVNRGPCGECKGEGRFRGKECTSCSAKGLISEPKVIDVEIKPGSSVGDILTFEECCSDDMMFDKPGDVLIRLIAADEDGTQLDIEREGKHLKYVCSITLVESLVGCKRMIKSHPGYKEGLEIDIPAGTQNTEVIQVKGKGMPGAIYGDLFIHVFIKVSEKEKNVLQSSKAILESMFN